MKYLRLLIPAVLLILAAGLGGLLFLCFEKPVLHLKGSNSVLLTMHYQAIRADEINAQGILLREDGELLEIREPGSLFMDDGMELRMPAGWLNDCFHCEVRVVEGCVLVQSAEADRANEAEMLTVDEEGRVSVAEAAQALGYTYSWAEEACELELTSPEIVNPELPAQYDLRQEGRVSPVRNQAQWATCWAFAALSAVESTLLPEVDIQFSAEHLNYHHGFLTDNAGGDFNMALAYMVSWKGPVTEEEDPYGDEYSPDGLTAAVHVQNAVILSEQDIIRLKTLIRESGAIESAIYARQDLESMSGFYDPETAGYYYSGEEIVNHDIDIIGWDDDFPKESFPEEPPGDGAFLCKNSWGESFGNNGYFYVSYYDVNIGRYGVAYTGVESSDNYDRIYQSDELGWTGAIGYGVPQAQFAAVYTAEQQEELAAAGFYSTDPGTWYDLYLVHDFESTEDFEDAQYLHSGYLPDRGYFTVDLGEGIPLQEGERFAVMVRIRTNDATHPVAMEYAGNEITSTVQVDDGETYLSPDGRTWTRAEEAAGGNVCLKAYTRED